jgi:hypothetical protein
MQVEKSLQLLVRVYRLVVCNRRGGDGEMKRYAKGLRKKERENCRSSKRRYFEGNADNES